MTPDSERNAANKVTIEDLLRLKRAERPSPEFWTRFERDLRAKQLAAMIEKRPWWVGLRLPQLGRQLARFQVPAGAAAALALSFVAVREYRSDSRFAPEIGPINAPAVSSSATVAHADPVRPDPAVREVAPAVRETVVAETPRMLTSSAEEAAVAEVPAGRETAFSPSDSLTDMIPWAAPASEDRSVAAAPSAPTGELPHVHFASLVAPGRDHDFASSVEVESLVVASRPQVADVQETIVPAALPSPREVRRDRILSNLASADVAAADGDRSRLGRIREILVSSLDDDRASETVRRVGMGGDRLTLKF